MSGSPVDHVEDSIRQWHQMRDQAKTSEERERQAVEEAQFLRGQNELLMLQKDQDQQELKQLRGQLDEAKVHVRSAGNIILELAKKLELGAYRAPASREAAGEPAPKAVSERFKLLEKTMDETVVELGAKHGADNPR